MYISILKEWIESFFFQRLSKEFQGCILRDFNIMRLQDSIQ